MTTNSAPNVVWHNATVTRRHRETLNGHRSAIVWFTGLSGAGKSTIAHSVEDYLFQLKCRTYVFDGDNVRHGLCGDLGFSPEDRHENLRRIGEMAKLFMDAGIIALTAFISPFQADRAMVRHMVESENFIEVYCSCPLEICEQRDSKGLYGRARRGEIAQFTGVSSPYEEPDNPELVLHTHHESIASSVVKVVDLLRARGILGADMCDLPRAAMHNDSAKARLP